MMLPGAPFLIAFALVLALGPRLIAFLKAKKGVQPISENAPEKHKLKHGTPTMGGLLILSATGLATLGWLVWERFQATESGSGLLTTSGRSHLVATLLVFLCGGMIGVLDDLGKARKKQNKAGLSERAKLGLQAGVAFSFALYLYFIKLDTMVLGVPLGPLYYVLAALCVIGFGNAVNFTDGLDGLASGTTLIASSALAYCAYAISGVTPEQAVFYGALAGACAGFLCFNAYPARVFMGDTGSLALGMGLSAAAIISQQEVLLFIIGAVYIVEIASMMIQRYVFKYRRIKHGLEYAQQNRVFRRAPLHHHFEELGWHEVQVVVRFWMVALVMALVGILFFGGVR
ncbi:phospho-N-acetylmuramoyl-pentapeptide-transferase [Armatimonas rosea]|uniref:Phospho-N-acetylmuramoyl-pentapeptide-transferase n=1 Tax=Armatimonas rosea TaxID=685828 RepID=A0A7W9W5M8_ARMRO|nr:phospho-N-acetylmuramoyl-pentapeptide-transferase [Armatimonas rosea]MBB6049728.1 phospho-N-acetylmuramoyl-pentapeptide-transferase [Armatimonas rosea]